MNTTKALGAVLALQLLFAVFTWWPETPKTPSRPVFDFALDEITALTVESETTRSRKKNTRLEKKDGQWVLASEFGYPAQTEKVETILEKVLAMRIRSPMTTDPVQHEALEVDDKHPTRRVSVSTSSGESIDILAGLSHGNRLNLRFEGEDEVYEVAGVPAWALESPANKYYDKRVLEVDPSTLDTYTLENNYGTLRLVRASDGSWGSEDLADGETLDPTKIDRLVNLSLTLDMGAVQDPVEPDPMENADVVVSWSVSHEGQAKSSSYGMQFLPDKVIAFRMKGNDHAMLTASDRLDGVLKTTTLEYLIQE